MFEFKKEDCKIDENFEGSLFERMDTYSGYLCPTCNAHLIKSMICLNACHLPKQWQTNFSKIMKGRKL